MCTIASRGGEGKEGEDVAQPRYHALRAVDADVSAGPFGSFDMPLFGPSGVLCLGG